MRYSYDRTAAEKGTLLEAKLNWAEEVAQQAVEYFENAWYSQRPKATVRKASDIVELKIRSDEYRWTAHADFKMSEEKVTAWVDLDNNVGKFDNIIEDLMNWDKRVKVLPIKDRTSPTDLIKELSLWFSNVVNKIPLK